METRRWTNPGQPQTLQIAVFLLYINAVLNVLFGAVFSVYGLLFTVGFAFGGFGIANEKKWGYWVAVLTAAAELALIALPTIVDDGVGSIFNIGLLLQLLFPVALFALLLHPMSRDYQRIWFR
jgi:hypothetical protein